MLKKTFILLTLFLFFYTATHAQFRAYSNEFMSLGVGARALAMGNVHTAITDDVTSAYWNPAGLNGVESLQVSAMHAEWFAGIGKYDYVGLAVPIANGERTIGVSVIRFGVDDIPNTLNVVDGSGNVNYDNITTFSAADYGILLSYAQRLKKFDRINIGGNVKIIHRQVGEFANSWGFGLDLGAQFRASDRLQFGATLRDATSTYNAWSFSFTEDQKQILAATGNEVPVNSVELTGQHLTVGGAYNFEFGDNLSLLTELDLEFTFGERNTLIHTGFLSLEPKLGVEAGFKDFVFLRLGINNFQRFLDETDINKTVLSVQPNVGLGLKFNDFIHIDYALTGFGNLSTGIYSHIFSLKLHFNRDGRS